tara:strand:+ start:134 stop:736 length:603 start_codon:yes stop_codon:yes gene_type:complete
MTRQVVLRKKTAMLRMVLYILTGMRPSLLYRHMRTMGQITLPKGLLRKNKKLGGLIRTGMTQLENMWLQDGGIKGDDWVNKISGGELEHQFMSGMYVRRVLLPAGMILTTKIHKVRHPFFMMKGRCRVLSAEDGVQDLVGPVMGITEAGTKRMMHIIEDVEWYTVHAVESTTPEGAESEIISKDFSGFDTEQIKQIMETN